jgi:hypothetical protein
VTWTLVQKSASVASSSTGTASPSLPGASTAGNLLVATLGGQAGGTQFTGPAGWVQGPQIGNGSNSRAEIWYYIANPGGITSASFTCSNQQVKGVLAEFHTDVANAVVALDFSGTGTAGAVAACTATASATSGDLAVCSFWIHYKTSQTITWTDPSGFTLLRSTTGPGFFPSYGAYDLSVSAGSLPVTGTSSVASGDTNAWTGAVATFVASSPSSQVIKVGASVQTTAFPGLTVPQAEAQFAALTGRPNQVKRVYFPAGVWPLAGSGVVDLTAKNVQDEINAGRKVLLSFRPAAPVTSQDDYARLVQILAAYQAAGLNAEVGLWHEPEGSANPLTAAQYAAMTAFYKTAITPYFPYVCILEYGSAARDPQGFTDYFNAVTPGTFSAAYIDFYCQGYNGGATLDGAAAAADAQGIPFGIAEWGCSITNNGLTSCINYINYITSFFAARISNGQLVGDIIWFNDGPSGQLAQAINTATDPRIPAYQTMFDALTSSGAGTVTVSGALNVAATPAATVTGGNIPAPAAGSPGAAGPPGFPVLIAEIGVVPTSPVPAPGTFLLSDPTFGLLNFDVLGGSTSWADTSGFVKSFTVTRTSTRQNAPVITYDPGTLSAVLDNTDGRFDPDNLSGPYTAAGVTQLHPMTPVRFRAAWQGTSYPLFSGYADGWVTPGTNYGPRTSETNLGATDGFKVLAGFQLAAYAADAADLPEGAAEDTGARISRVLGIAGWDNDARAIGTGNSQLQGTSYASSDALTEMQLAADTELGELYINGSGKVTFRRRRGVMEDTRSTVPQAVFGDQPGDTELPYTALGRANDDVQLLNDCQITAAGSSNLQEATDAASVARFLYVRSYQRSDLLLESDTEALQWAQFVVYLSKGAEDRFDTITLSPQRDPRLWPHALGREIGDMITVIRRPPGMAAITKQLIIRGITHTVTVNPALWQTQWMLQDASRYAFFTLGDSVRGALDANALAY